MNYNEIIHHILELDKSIICAAIAKLRDGKILATKYKEQALGLLTRQESELLIAQSLIRMSTRSTLEYKLGKTLYSNTVYEKMITASMYLFSNGGRRKDNNNNNNNDSILVLSFDKNADHELIINSKVLPYLKEKYKTSTEMY